MPASNGYLTPQEVAGINRPTGGIARAALIPGGMVEGLARLQEALLRAPRLREEGEHRRAEDARRLQLDTEESDFKKQQLDETKRHNSAVETADLDKALGAPTREVALDPNIEDDTWDPKTYQWHKSSRLKTDTDIEKEMAVRQKLRDGASPGKTAPGKVLDLSGADASMPEPDYKTATDDQVDAYLQKTDSSYSAARQNPKFNWRKAVAAQRQEKMGSP